MVVEDELAVGVLVDELTVKNVAAELVVIIKVVNVELTVGVAGWGEGGLTSMAAQLIISATCEVSAEYPEVCRYAVVTVKSLALIGSSIFPPEISFS